MNKKLVSLLALLLLTIPFICVNAQIPTNINEEEGSITNKEIELLEKLHEQGIPVPDSIKIIKVDNYQHGAIDYDYLKRMKIVLLTDERLKHPNADNIEKFPYLFGREKIDQSIKGVHAHVFAHEIAHVIGPKLKAEYGRPAVGIHVSTDEVQAEILGAVLGRVAFGWNGNDLGFPEKIDYPFLDRKSTKLLERQYCFIVKRTWNVEDLECEYDLK